MTAANSQDRSSAAAGVQPALDLVDPLGLPRRPSVDRAPPVAAVAVLFVLALLLGAAAIAGLWYAWPSDQPVEQPGSSRSIYGREVPELLPTTPPPTIAPIEYVALPREQARLVNARQPFVAGPIAPAPPLLYAGSAEDRERAVTCLAAAAYYEAGGDPPGRAAVIQVVLNRVRHPAFPATVCGVVFQGSERSTGCQFTFTCDGALARVPVQAIWARARGEAEAALGGFVFRPVGTATHYHTDWVVPTWGPELDKIAQVHTHLFFRFKGGWGRPGVLRRGVAAGEPIDRRIAALARPTAGEALVNNAPALSAAGPTIDGSASVAASPGGALPVGATDLGRNVVRLSDPVFGQYALALDPDAFPGSYAVLAWKLCRTRTPCRVAGWRNPAAVPRSLPLSGDWRAQLSFLYEKTGADRQVSRWDCTSMPRPNKDQCLPTRAVSAAPSIGSVAKSEPAP